MEWIVTDNIYAETWRRLLEFANVDLAYAEIVRRQSSDQSDRENYKKQARQMRACVLQAKEYFDAAVNSSLVTSANHLYYGVMSLASTMMLVLGDGTKSLDYLRGNSKNRHHGLDFSTGCTAKKASDGITLLEQSFVRVLERGHFSNWYSVLPTTGDEYANLKRFTPNAVLSSREPVGTHKAAALIDLSKRRQSLLSLLRFLPDLQDDLSRYGVENTSSRSALDVEMRPDGTMKYTWRIHGASSRDKLEAILNRFEIDPRYAECFSWNIDDRAYGGIVYCNFNSKSDVQFSWPSVRETMSHESVSYADELVTHEIVDCYLVSYQLSMLARYFPDLWVACLESHGKAAKVIERAVGTIIKKLPILALSMLSRSGLMISTHLRPWA